MRISRRFGLLVSGALALGLVAASPAAAQRKHEIPVPTKEPPPDGELYPPVPGVFQRSVPTPMPKEGLRAVPAIPPEAEGAKAGSPGEARGPEEPQYGVERPVDPEGGNGAERPVPEDGDPYAKDPDPEGGPRAPSTAAAKTAAKGGAPANGGPAPKVIEAQ